MGFENNNTENVLLLMHSQDKVCWLNLSPPKAWLTLSIIIASEGASPGRKELTELEHPDTVYKWKEHC